MAPRDGGARSEIGPDPTPATPAPRQPGTRRGSPPAVAAPQPPRAGVALPPAQGPLPYCLEEGVNALQRQPWGRQPAPWSPARRERMGEVERAGQDRTWTLSEMDIFCDLTPTEIDALGKAAPMRTYPAGAMVYSPHKPSETLFILRGGRIRVFRVSGDGRALTTAIITPGTIFGEMVLLGQSMHDNYAEALDEAVVCVMARSDVHTYLLADPRISARITTILGERLLEMERRLSDSVFKSVPERIAATLISLASQQRRYRLASSASIVALTHEQIAALAGTSRETTTKILGEFADQGLVKLGRGRITILDSDALKGQTGN